MNLALTRRHLGFLAAGSAAALTLPRVTARAALPLAPLAPAGGPARAVLAGVAKGSSEEIVEDAVRRAPLEASDFFGCWRTCA